MPPISRERAWLAGSKYSPISPADLPGKMDHTQSTGRQRRSLLDFATKAELKLVSTLKQYFPVTVGIGITLSVRSPRNPRLSREDCPQAYTERRAVATVVATQPVTICAERTVIAVRMSKCS